MRRYGLYFMSSTRWEVLRRFCGKWEEDWVGESSVECSMDGRWEPGVGGRGDRAGRDASFAARDTRGRDGTTPSSPPRGLLNLARNQSPRHRVSVRLVKNAAYPQPLMGETWMLRIVSGACGRGTDLLGHVSGHAGDAGLLLLGALEGDDEANVLLLGGRHDHEGAALGGSRDDGRAGGHGGRHSAARGEGNGGDGRHGRHLLCRRASRRGVE